MKHCSKPISCALTLVFTAAQAIPISIDLRPDDPPPTIIAPQAAGRLPVGILTTDDFDATSLSPATLRLGRTGTEAAPLRVARMDLDGDGDVDLQVFFGIADMGVGCEDRVVILKGRTMDGQEVEASAPIVTEEC